MTTVETATIRSVIVDDEPLARELLRSMLAEHPAIEVVGEYGDGAAAVRGIEHDAPDLLFLDIQMPERDGFEVLRALDPERMPAVVFVTAYDQYALRAFEVHALDYLLKPFDEERLERAVRRAREQLLHPGRGADYPRLLALLEQIGGPQAQYLERLPIRVGERTILLRTSEIEWIEAEGKYVRVHAGGQAHLIRDTMKQMEQALDPSMFLRVSRSAIVNLDRVREIQPWFSGDHLLVMQGGAQVSSTRGYREAMRRLLNRSS